MTLEVEYTANGASNVFPFPFAIETEVDCQVLVNGVPQTGDYCIRGQGSIDGGAVVFDSAPATGLVITLRRRSDLRISAVDAEGGYLADKLLAGDNITLETVTQGGVQRLRIASTGQDVSVAELAAVLKAGANITLIPDGNGRLVVAAKSVDASDLAAVLKAGGNVSLQQDASGRLVIAAESVDATELLAVLRAGANVTVTADGAGHVVVAADSVDASDLAAVLKAGGNISLQQDASGRLVIAAESVDATELLAVLRAGANVTVTADGAGHVVVAADSVDADDLAAKLKAGTNITLNTDTEADGVQKVRIDASVGFNDVAAKLKAGKNIIFTQVEENGVKTLDIAAHDNALTDKILSVITAAGIVPDEADHTQLRQAVVKLIDASAQIDSMKVLAKSAAYTALAADRTKLIDCTGSWTLGLTTADTLGDGWWCAVRNSGTGTITIGPNATELIDGAVTSLLAPGESCLIVCSGVAFKTVLGGGGSSGGSWAPGYISGLNLIWSTATAVSVAPGGARDIRDTANLKLPVAWTGIVQGGWTAGNGAAKLDTGAKVANTWYHVFVIGGPGVSTDILISASLAAPTLPAGYTAKRRIGSVLTDNSGNLVPWITPGGGMMLWSTPRTDLSGAPPGNLTISAPPGVRCRVAGQCQIPASFNTYSLRPTDGVNGTPPNLWLYNLAGSLRWESISNTAAQININGQNGSVVLTTESYIDPREGY